MKKFPYILIVVIALLAIVFFGRAKRFASDKNIAYPIYVAYSPNLEGFMGPIGKNYSLSWEVPYEGNSHSLLVWCSEYSESEALLHFILSGPGPSDGGEAEETVRIDPSIENTLTIFDSIVVRTKPKG